MLTILLAFVQSFRSITYWNKYTRRVHAHQSGKKETLFEAQGDSPTLFQCQLQHERARMHFHCNKYIYFPEINKNPRNIVFVSCQLQY